MEVMTGAEMILLFARQLMLWLFSFLRRPSKVNRDVTTFPDETFKDIFSTPFNVCTYFCNSFYWFSVLEPWNRGFWSSWIKHSWFNKQFECILLPPLTSQVREIFSPSKKGPNLFFTWLPSSSTRIGLSGGTYH